MTDIPITFGARLRQFRETLGLSLKDIAMTLGVTVDYLSDVELGKCCALDSEHVQKLRTHFGPIVINILDNLALRERYTEAWYVASFSVLNEIEARATILVNDALHADDVNAANDVIEDFRQSLVDLRNELTRESRCLFGTSANVA